MSRSLDAPMKGERKNMDSSPLSSMPKNIESSPSSSTSPSKPVFAAELAEVFEPEDAFEPREKRYKRREAITKEEKRLTENRSDNKKEKR